MQFRVVIGEEVYAIELLWTHVHRGVTLEQGVKYIATTWICFA